MRHKVAGGQLNRTSSHRVALRRNLAASLFEHETISTTMPKAKHVKSFVEKLITLAKKGDLAARRRAISLLGNRNIVEEVDGEVKKKGTVIGKLFSEIGPRYLDRAGGYTRIIKTAKVRLGDNSQLVLLQLVGQESKPEATEKAGKKKALKKKASKSEKTEE
jgi:large subunit ribosomal protein L17